jgi:hypothetical protein
MNDQPLSPDEVQLTRWLDRQPGAMPPDHMDPQDAARHQADTEVLAALLRTHAPAPAEPPYPDFFNSQILKKIRDEQAPSRSPARQSVGLRAALTAWLRRPWWGATAAATAALALVALASWNRIDRGAEVSGTRVLSVFSPEPNAIARIHAAKDRHAVIITLDGLEAFPSDRMVVGQFSDESRPLVAVHQP